MNSNTLQFSHDVRNSIPDQGMQSLFLKTNIFVVGYERKLHFFANNVVCLYYFPLWTSHKSLLVSVTVMSKTALGKEMCLLG